MYLYQILGVGKKTSQKTIKKAYRAMSKKAHPDTEDGSDEKFGEISTAYTVLSDKKSRAQYDETGEYNTAPQPDKDAEAHGVIAGAMMQVFQRQEDVTRSDIKFHMSDMMLKQIQSAEQGNIDMEKGITRAEKMVGRFKNKKRRKNRLDEMARWNVDNLRTGIERNKTIIANFEKALGIMDDYNYEYDQDTRGRSSNAFFLGQYTLTGARCQ